MQILTLDETAQFLGVHASTIGRLVRRCAIPHFKVGRHYRFTAEVLSRWMAERQVTASELGLRLADAHAAKWANGIPAGAPAGVTHTHNPAGRRRTPGLFNTRAK